MPGHPIQAKMDALDHQVATGQEVGPAFVTYDSRVIANADNHALAGPRPLPDLRYDLKLSGHDSTRRKQDGNTPTRSEQLV